MHVIPQDLAERDGAIFINYRGRDSRSYGALLYLELSRRFGPDRVFLDCESIPAGADFVDQLLNRVRRARVVLAVIGPGWLAGGGLRRRPRIKESTDWTRRELAEAMLAGVRVIPVLTDDTDMPTDRQLPACLAALSRCQYRRLRCREAAADLDRIVADLIAADPTLALAAAVTHRRRPPDPAVPPAPTPAPLLPAPSASAPAPAAAPPITPPPAPAPAAAVPVPGVPPKITRPSTALAGATTPDSDPADGHNPAAILARRLAIAAARAARAAQQAPRPAPDPPRPPHMTLYRSLVAGRRRCWQLEDPRRLEA